MFYSHEILTSRRSGLATVWLAATLGSTSSLKKLNRKAIFDVNVPKTCDIIIHPEAPMALRLQSNLLYGVSRIYSQQSSYVLSDAQIAQANMRTLLKAVRTSELDPKAGKARPEQLMLEDDPAFTPEMNFPDLDLDFSALDLSTDRSSHRSSILSPHSHRTSLSSQSAAEESMQGLVLPSSGSAGIGGFQLPSEHGSSVQRRERLARLLEDDGDVFNIDPGFSIDAEGNLIEEVDGEPAAESVPVRIRSDAAFSEQVRPRGEARGERDQAEEIPMNLDFEMPHFDDEQLILPDAEPFPPMALDQAGRPDQQRSSTRGREDEDYSETAEAPIRRRPRKPRPLPLDERMELRNADLAGWKDNYAANMLEASRAKQQHQALSLAKKNAAQWVAGLGIAGVGAPVGTSSLKGPLEDFAGDALLDKLLGPVAVIIGRKRRRSDLSEDGKDSETQRRRMRETQGEFGLGDDGIILQDDDLALQASDGTEIGRHAPTPLADDPTFPWNTTASALRSRHGSSIPLSHHPGSLAGIPFSAAGAPLPQPPLPPRRGSRIPTASPLVGRGTHRFSSLELPGEEPEPGFPSSSAIAGLAGDEYDDFQMHGPAAAVGTQTQAQSQWLRDTLDREAGNFLEFVRESTMAREGAVGEEDELAAEPREGGWGGRVIEFEELLPPGMHSTVVAAQALHHVLALATAGKLEVEQVEAFGAISMSVVRGGGGSDTGGGEEIEVGA